MFVFLLFPVLPITFNDQPNAFFFQASRYVRLNVKGCPALRDVTLNICVLVVHIYVLNLLRALLSQLSSASCLV